MDLSLVIGIVSLVVTALAEGRAFWRDRSKDEQITGFVGLLRLVQSLDRILAVGERLLRVLSDIPLSGDDAVTRHAILRNKEAIVGLVKSQAKNLTDLSEVLDAPLFDMGADVKLTVSDAIEIVEPDMVVRTGGPKVSYLKALSWKLLEDEPRFSRLRLVIGRAMHCLATEVSIDERPTRLAVSAPARINVKCLPLFFTKEDGPPEVTSFQVFDLRESSDVAILLSRATAQLEEMRELRAQVAEMIRSSFKIESLLR